MLGASTAIKQVDRTSQGDYPLAALAGFVCLGSLSGIAWSLNVRS